jgi:hypothetical protein
VRRSLRRPGLLRRLRPFGFLKNAYQSLQSKGQMMSFLLQLFTAAPLKNYRTQVLGAVVFLTAIANWLVGDMSFVDFVQNLPAMVGGLGLSALGAKINAVKPTQENLPEGK